MSDFNIKEIMEIEADASLELGDDILINEEGVDDNSYKNCVARMDALKKIKKSVRDNYKAIASTLSIDEKIKFETAYSALKQLEEDEAFKMINAR